MFKIIDNSITKKNQKFLINLMIENRHFPWFFMKDVTKTKDGDQKRPAFSHYFVLHSKTNSNFFNSVKPIFSKYIRKNIINFKSILQLPSLDKKTYDTPHIDMKKPHSVYLYYILDSDGETIFFKNKKIFKKIKPKQGRLVIFNGDILHTAYQPKKNIRCVININEEK